MWSYSSRKNKWRQLLVLYHTIRKACSEARIFAWHLKDTAESWPMRLNRQVEFLIVDIDPRISTAQNKEVQRGGKLSLQIGH